MSISKTVVRARTVSLGYEFSLWLCIFFLSVSNSHFCSATPATAHKKVVIAEKKDKKKGTILPKGVSTKSKDDAVLHLTDWWQISALADKLIDDNKFDEAERLLNSILPRAKKQAPESLDYALTLCRLSTDLYGLKKYPQALARIQEAIVILGHHSVDIAQQRVMWRCLGTKVAILLAMQKNSEAENLARKIVAYAIAFPNVITAKQTKIAYGLLRNSLEAQKKFEEAKKINEIMNQQ